jgi:Protein of unknown function with PCYCGC motif
MEMMKKHWAYWSGALLLMFAGGFLTGCGGGTADEGEREVAMASLKEMPDAVKRSAANVRKAYQFAVANPEVLQEVPCYCGCGGMGHTSNYSCYVNVTQDAARQFDGHALGCSICVDIALDAMRMLKQGKSTPEIRLYVDVIYSKYGPSNML